MRLAKSLRWQLTLAFTGVAAAVVVAIAGGMAVVLEHAVWAHLDAALEEEAETLVGLRGLGQLRDFTEAVARIGSERDLGTGKFIRMIESDGTEVVRFGAIPHAIAAAGPPGARGRRHLTVGQRRDARRVFWYATPDGGWMEIGVAVGDHLATIRSARMAIAGAAAFLLTALALLALTITTRATAELARLSAELETVEAGSLGRRLAPRSTTEVDRLAGVLNRLLARLEGAVADLRRFTADSAHELRTPIAALRAHIEVALGRAREPHQYRDALLDALEQTERLGQVAEQLLALNAVEAGVPWRDARAETVHLDALAREVAEFLEPVAQEQGRGFRCVADGAVVVHGAPDLLKRLVLNLVDNAFRHTPASAAVEIAVRTHDSAATIEVRDRGPGIPPGDVPHVFERFHRGRTATAGTGLGLALCREIATRHGGEIVLDSTPGAGTTVTVTLPLADGGTTP